MNYDHEQILKRVSKPSQYLGSEINSIRKEGPEIKIRIALAFPDLYEVGMSHLGLSILYHILNRQDFIAAERVFAPDTDYAQELEKLAAPLPSLESKIPLNRFDAVGFTLQYELSYTNILHMLRLGKIPINAAERTKDDPLILGGGPCAFNPEPLAQFFDLFIIGDGEEVILEIAQLLATAKNDRLSRRETLKRFSEIKGVYVPLFFKVDYYDSGSVREIIPEFPEKPHVQKRLVRSLEEVDYPTMPIVPFAQLIHERISLEIDRGCTQGCRFCQAGMIYRPVRERSCGKVEKLLDQSLASSGFEEFSLLSLSSGDFSLIDPLVSRLVQKYKERRVALSLPSLRPGTIRRELMEAIRSVRKTGFTVAVEAGTERLRKVINKAVSEENVLMTVADLASLGWNHLKLYFMIGLPTETEEDIREIHKLCLLVLKTANRKGKQIRNINLGIGYFVPKSHTPFQWFPQDNVEDFKEKMELLRSLFKKNREFSLKRQSPHASFLEAVFAKGDRRLGKVIEKAFEAGCRFDGWGERFRYDLWQGAFEECGIDPTFFANRKIPLEENLPWSHIKTGVSDDFLKEEYKKSFEGHLTEDCRLGKCKLCGMQSECKTILSSLPGNETSFTEVFSGSAPSFSSSTVRICYKKTGSMKYLSHLDLNRVIHRSCLRASLPLVYTEGFHPHPKISYASALPLGTESFAEYADIHFKNISGPDTIQKKLNAVFPEGLEVLSACLLPPGSASLSGSMEKIDYEIKVRRNGGAEKIFARKEELESAIVKILETKELILERLRKGRMKKINLSPFVEEIKLKDFSEETFCLFMTLVVIDSRQIQPADVLKKMVKANHRDKLEMDVVKKKVYFRNRADT